MNRYFYIDTEGKQKGTFSPQELRQEQVKKDTLVWTQGMEQWKRADEVAELSLLFDTASTMQNTIYGQCADLSLSNSSNTATDAQELDG